MLVPRSLASARWAEANGAAVPNSKPPADTDERLPDRQGDENQPAMFLSSAWPRIRRSPHYEKFVQFPVELPPQASGLRQATVPVRVKVQADELPEAIGEYVRTTPSTSSDGADRLPSGADILGYAGGTAGRAGVIEIVSCRSRDIKHGSNRAMAAMCADSVPEPVFPCARIPTMAEA